MTQIYFCDFLILFVNQLKSIEIYFDTDYVTVKYDAVYHIVISISNLPPTSKEFRDAMMAVLGAMQHFKAGRVV